MKRHVKLWILVSILFTFWACGGNKFDVDTSKVNIDLNIRRLDKDLMANYPDTPDVYNLIKKYDGFLELYSEQIIQLGPVNQRDYSANLLDFNKYCQEYSIPAQVDAVFGDLSELKLQLTNAFKYFKYYFPEKKIPEIYTYLSNFSHSIAIDEGIIGIGLDKYLGTNCEMYGKLGIDNYKIQKMHKHMLPVDCMRAIAENEFPYHDSANSLVNQMVHEGKIQYFIDAVLPFTPDTLKFGYTSLQLEWAQYNEQKMWAYLIEKELLFSTDELTIRKMISDGPFTTLFANNSAPRAGAFIGWKIIKQYMEENPGVRLQQLMQNNDYQGILNSAAYKP
jgi:hypothetical protein